MSSSDVASAAQASAALRSLIRTSVPYMSLSIKSTKKQRKCPDGSEEAGEHVAMLLLN